jgi:hypothetical protein
MMLNDESADADSINWCHIGDASWILKQNWAQLHCGPKISLILNKTGPSRAGT